MTAQSSPSVPPTLTQNSQLSIFEARSGPLEFAEFGKGPSVLCLHGAMGGHDQGLILARTLGESGYRYIAISRPGYLGTPLERRATPEQQADLFAELLDGLGIQSTAVMAVSGGGPSAIHFALRHPERCWGLVLVSTVADKVDNRLPFSFKVTKVLSRLPWFLAKVKRDIQNKPELAAKRSISDATILERTRRDSEAWGLFTDLLVSTVDRMPQRITGTENDVETTRTRSYPLEEIGAPTLIIQGTKDPLVPFSQNGAVFAQRVPNVDLVALEGGEHVAIFTHRNEARERAMIFLRQYAPQSSSFSEEIGTIPSTKSQTTRK